MSTMERIDFLQETIREQEEIIKNERERIKCLRERCAVSAELICRLNEQTMKRQMDRPADAGSKHAADGRPALIDDEKIWPHIQGRAQVNLREQLWEIQVELKGIENKMLDGTRAQLRKWAVQMEEIKRLKEQIEQAILSVESWERLFLMFMDDMDIRRHSGMDERFYQMERQDIKQKMGTCKEFYDKIGREIEEAILLHNQELMGESLMKESLFRNGTTENPHEPERKERQEEKEIAGGSPDSLKIRASLPDEIKTEIQRYAIGILFLEDHLYKLKRAEEKRNSAGHMLDRLREEYEIEKRWISHMEFAY